MLVATGRHLDSVGRATARTPVFYLETSLTAQPVKYLPAMWETRDRSLDWEDPLEKGMATHSKTLAWRIPLMEEHGRL